MVSKYSYLVLLVFSFLLLVASALFVLGVTIIVMSLKLDVLFVGLFLIWIASTPFFVIARQYKVIVITETQVIIRWVFGLVKRAYLFDSLKRNDYRYTTGGVILKPVDGEQITLGEKEFRNYLDLKSALDSVIEIDHDLKLTYLPKSMRIWTLIGVLLLILVLVMKL